MMSAEKRNLVIAASFGRSGLFLAMLAMWLDLWTMRVWHTWVALAMASFAFFWTGRHIIRMASGATRRGITNQHVLPTAGTLGGYIGGCWVRPSVLRLWVLKGVPAVDFHRVVTFLTTDHLLSAYVSMFVRTRASQSVRKLLDL